MITCLAVMTHQLSSVQRLISLRNPFQNNRIALIEKLKFEIENAVTRIRALRFLGTALHKLTFAYRVDLK